VSNSDEIEALLKGASASAPDALRGRVLTAMRSELERRRAVRFWRVAAAAAAVLLWLHVSWSAALGTRLEGGADLRPELDRLARQIEDLAPGLPEAETRRLAVVLHAGASTPWTAMPARGGMTHR
jgi:hypothetical protein